MKETMKTLKLESGHELKPCPFCGGLDLSVSNEEQPLFSVSCYDCGAVMNGEEEEEEPGGRSTRCHYDPKGKSPTEANYKNLWPEYRYAFENAVEAWNRRAGAE